MKFYGTGMVWNPGKDRPLCRFKNGELDTENNDIIAKLLELGYKTENGSEIVIFDAPEETIEDVHIKCGPHESFSNNYEDDELRQLAKANKIASWHNKRIEKIVEELVNIDVLIA